MQIMYPSGFTFDTFISMWKKTPRAQKAIMVGVLTRHEWSQGKTTCLR